MRKSGVQKDCCDLGEETRQAQDQQCASGSALRQMAVAARTEWFRQMRLQSAVFAMQLNVRGGLATGDEVVADAERIFEFLTKEDVH